MSRMKGRRRNAAIATAVSAFGLAAVCLIMLWVLYMKNEECAVSVFSWNYELEDAQLVEENAVILQDYHVTRVYQLFSEDYIKSDQMRTYMENLSGMGVSVAALTGDKSWIEDGLTEFRGIVDALHDYNEQVDESVRISQIALDVECHALPGWQEDPKGIFAAYVQLMREAKQYAGAHDLGVIQVIPTFYDDVDSELFETFLQECCDEISVMNYNKQYAMTAIRTEYEMCRQYEIPIESVFELMPVDALHGVTKALTYYNDGRPALENAMKDLREQYGPELGMGLHHFSALKELKKQEG